MNVQNHAGPVLASLTPAPRDVAAVLAAFRTVSGKTLSVDFGVAGSTEGTRKLRARQPVRREDPANGTELGRVLSTAVKASAGSGPECRDRVDYLSRGKLPPPWPPQPVGRGQPGPIGRPIASDPAPGRRTAHRLEVLVLRGTGLGPRPIESPRRVLVEPAWQRGGPGAAAVGSATDDRRFPSIGVQRPAAIGLGRLTGGWAHAGVALGTPQRRDGWQPPAREFGGLGNAIATRST